MPDTEMLGTCMGPGAAVSRVRTPPVVCSCQHFYSLHKLQAAEKRANGRGGT
ncbi:hypothetical protein DENSPDRAFT_831609 [Dentipellis sp. KUC8613]|nr:hypothetical protein DENSPDRAFT_831609 [Dentipellis sp. KUC8613]